MKHVIPDLHSLVLLFYPRVDQLAQFAQVTADDMPAAYRALLDHQQHMTVTVQSHHGGPVDVQVLRWQEDGDVYSREILLRRQSDGRVVQFGIVRLRMSYLDPSVRAEIAARQVPLGRVLIDHNVLREVELDRLWQVTTGPDLTRLFALDGPTATYGRTALIHCHGEPAVELLEIVIPESRD